MTLLSDFTILVGAILSLVLIVLLTKSKNWGLDKLILLVLFGFIFFSCIHAYATLHELKAIYYLSYLFDYSLFWFLGPLVLLYVKELQSSDDALIKKNSIHFLPGLIITLVVFVPKMLHLELYSTAFAYVHFYQENQLAFILLRNIYFSVYLILALRLFLDFKLITAKSKQFSTEEYGWIHRLLIGSLGFVTIDLGIRCFELFVFELAFDGGYVTILAMVIFVSYLGYKGINESSVLIPKFLPKKNDPIAFAFTSSETAALEQQLMRTLVIEKGYRDENLSLKSVSKSLAISEKKLSAFLNNQLDIKFKDFVNYYRVAEVKERLKANDDSKYTLLAIANECGFNSKASFYRIFKKHTGCSPTAYKKNISKS